MQQEVNCREHGERQRHVPGGRTCMLPESTCRCMQGGSSTLLLTVACQLHMTRQAAPSKQCRPVHTESPGRLCGCLREQKVLHTIVLALGIHSSHALEQFQALYGACRICGSLIFETSCLTCCVGAVLQAALHCVPWCQTASCRVHLKGWVGCQGEVSNIQANIADQAGLA